MSLSVFEPFFTSWHHAQGVPDSSCVFPAQFWNQPLTQWAPVLLTEGRYLETTIWSLGGIITTGMFLLFGSSQWMRLENTRNYILTHIYTHLYFFLYLSVCVYYKSWIRPDNLRFRLNTTGVILAFLSAVCNFLLQQWETRSHYPNVFTCLLSPSMYVK